ncbi:hypothetical protein F6456_02205 [Streptomyces sp. LBUM 1484]|nr:hypothetical protein [Streptomyces sp. LBUM 1484]
MPFTKIVRCHALVGEARRIGRDRPADAWTHAEDSLRGAAERRADAWVRTEAGRTVEPAVATIKGLHAEARFLGHQLASLHERRYVGPHGESYTTAEAHGRHADWAARVEDEERAGSRAHRRIPPRAKKLLLGLLALDVIVLTFLMAKFLNVDLRRALLSADSVLRAVTALLFGILGTVGVALTMKLFGRRHRAYRAAHGGWDLAGGGSSRGGVKTLVSELLLCGLLALALGAAMAWRLVLDGPSDQRLLTGVMAALFALVIGAVAYLSYQSEFADGSTTTEAIDVLAPQLHGTHRTEEALRAKREILLRQAARLTARLARDCARLRPRRNAGSSRAPRTGPSGTPVPSTSTAATAVLCPAPACPSATWTWHWPRHGRGRTPKRSLPSPSAAKDRTSRATRAWRWWHEPVGRARSTARRAWAVGEIIAAVTGAGQAPPPPGMPAYLQQQYAEHSGTRTERLGRDTGRLTATDRRPTTGLTLDRDSARRLRGGKK